MKYAIFAKIIPGIQWLKGYSAQEAVADFIAGITVGLTVIPQSLAYSTLAGLPPQFGLYSAFMGGIIYALFGSCRQVTIGPTALLALMTSKHTIYGLESGQNYATLLCFLSGIVEMVMAFLKLGALVDLISLPVTVGFTSATAVIIGFSQLKGLLGLKGKSSPGFIDTIKFVFTNAHLICIPDLALGICSICILLLLRKLKDCKFKRIKWYKAINTIFWIIGTARNALIVTITSLIAFYTQYDDGSTFVLTGSVEAGLPSFKPPPFDTIIETENNSTMTQDFTNMISELGSSIVMVPVIAVLGNVAISKAFGGYGIDASRELMALSLSNILGSFFSSIPVTGSFSRSAVNHASGVRTPIGGIYTSILVILALAMLTPYFQYIPKAALSAVIISAVIFMIEYEVIRPLWKCSRRELLPGAITFILSLAVGVEIGLFIGVVTDLAFLVHRAARPVLFVEKTKTTNDHDYIMIRPKHSLLYFPAIEWVRNGIANSVKTYGNIPIVLDCRHLNEFDFTAARGMSALQKELKDIQVDFYLLGPSSETVLMMKEASKNNITIAHKLEDLEQLLPDRMNDLFKDHGGLPLLKCESKINVTINES